MKRLMTALALTLASCQPAAAQNTFTDCYDLDAFVTNLADQGHQIQMVVKNESEPNPGGHTILVANTDTGAWFLLAISNAYPELVCAMQFGHGYGAGSLVLLDPVGDPL